MSRVLPPNAYVLAAVEDLDPAARAVLDLSLRWGMDDEQLALVGHAPVGDLEAMRAEAIQLVTAGADIAPADEVDEVRRALAHLYEDANDLSAYTTDDLSRELDELLPGPAPDLEPLSALTTEELTRELEEILRDTSVPEPVAEPEPEPEPARRRFRVDWLLLGILAIATVVRLWQINRLGLNSDEAVYAGQGAAIANDGTLEPFFPAFRAHPLLFQTLLSIGDHLGILAIFGRVMSALIGVGTVALGYGLGKLLYGRRTGLFTALILALMPYHVVVTRQILLDGPMVVLTTLTLYLVARFAVTRSPNWLYAAGASMGLALMAKETSVVLLGSVYAFLALTPAIRVPAKRLLASAGVMAAVVVVYPISLFLAGKTQTGGNYLAWQLFRRPNHGWLFYLQQVPVAMGLGVVLLAALGVWLLRKSGSWRETLLLAWIAVPLAFFQLWPVKGFQYLLPVAPAVAVLAARTLAHWGEGRSPRTLLGDRRLVPVMAVLLAASLLVVTIGRIDSSGATFLAGSGGVPGGREAGQWVDRHVPEGAHMLTVGPSMANIIQFYGHRKAYGLAVSPNPLNRNPSYDPVLNPDREIRSNELQYLVWDAYSGTRSKFFSRALLRFADRYHGRVVHTETVATKTKEGRTVQKPVIVIYEVRP
jgi:hypothetical protein